MPEDIVLNEATMSYEERVQSFTEDQRKAFDAMCSGKNVFLSGEAGTGKSFVLDTYIHHCGLEHKQVLAMAPTGIAALRLTGGTTIHRTLGIPGAFCDPNQPLGMPRRVLRAAEVIIIDEVSMCRVDLFERVMRMVFSAQQSSGTKQVILVGDFFQLPPVVTNRDLPAMMEFYSGNPEGYCFKSSFWKGLALDSHVLTEVHRTVDPTYIAALNAARRGDPSCVGYFNQRAISSRDQAPSNALWLCTRNNTADKINADRLAGLRGRTHTWTADVTGVLNESDKPTADKLPLKVGARVMSVRNDPDGLFLNGSIGTVTGFDVEGVYVLFDDADDECLVQPYTWQIQKASVSEGQDEEGNKVARIKLEEVGRFKQVPLRLAWAVTIHKAQGQTIAGPVAAETHVFASGQLYVALSRSSRVEDLYLYPRLEARYIHAQAEVQEFYDSLVERGYDMVAPAGAADLALPAEVTDYMRTNGVDLATAMLHFVQLAAAAS